MIDKHGEATRARGLQTLLCSLLAVLATALCSAQSFDDAWCGRGGSELPALWMQTWLQVEALEEMPNADAWTNAPGRISAFLRNATLLHRGSVSQGSKTMEQAQSTVQFFGHLKLFVQTQANRASAPSFI